MGGSVLFTLPDANMLMAYRPASARTEVLRRFTCGADGIAVAPDGALYVCQSTSRRVARLHTDGSTSVLPYLLEGRLHNFPRKLDVDPSGAIWFSDTAKLVSPGPQIYPVLDHASVLRLSPSPRGPRLERMTFDTAAPSAVLFSADGRVLFVSENDPNPEGKRELRAYPVERSGLGKPQVLWAFGADWRGAHRGIDGMCLDENGNIVACSGGAAGSGPTVSVMDPKGRVLEGHAAPAEMIGCTFGDEDLGSLYLTSAEGELWRTRDTGLRGRSRASPR